DRPADLARQQRREDLVQVEGALDRTELAATLVAAKLHALEGVLRRHRLLIACRIATAAQAAPDQRLPRRNLHLEGRTRHFKVGSAAPAHARMSAEDRLAAEH